MTAYERLTAMLADAGPTNPGVAVLRQLVPERLAKQSNLYPTQVRAGDGRNVQAVAIVYVSQRRQSYYQMVALETGETIVQAGEGTPAARTFAAALA